MSMFDRRITMTVVLLLALAGAAAAQPGGRISGTVLDPSGAPISAVRIELRTGAAAVHVGATDANGRYRIGEIVPGEYLVVIVAPGFPVVERHVAVDLSGSASLDVKLEVPALDERVTVTAESSRTQVEAQRALTPGGVTVVDGAALFSRHISGIADMLRYVPGMFSESSFGAEELFFSSRGSNLDGVDYDKNGIKLLQDGLPVTTADGNNHNRVIDPLTARYASVARGANALTYGASTLGGAIDFSSPTARNTAPIALFFDGGSFGSLNGRATLGGVLGSVDGLVTVEGRNWEGYRDHSRQERWGVYGNAGWQVTPAARVQLFGTYVDNNQRLPGALTGAEVDADPDQASAAALSGDYGKVVRTGRFAARTEWSLGSHASLSAGVSYEGQSLVHPIVNQIFVDFDGPGPNAPVEVFSLLIDTDHRDLGTMLRYDRRMGGHDLLVGLNYGDGTVEGGNYRNLNGRPNGISEYYDSRADSLEVFAMDRWRIASQWTAVFGAQIVTAARDVRVTNAASGAITNPDARYTALNPRAGAIASLDRGGEVYGNVSRLFEAPTTFQIIDDVRGGNQTVDPMAGTVAEIGWRSTTSQAAGGRWRWDVAAYYARLNDEILSMDDPGAPGNTLVTNFDSTVHAGIEALVAASFGATRGHHRVDPQVSVTVNRFRFAGDPVYGDNQLPAAPTYSARGEVVYRHTSGFYAGPTFDFVGARYADFTSHYRVAGYGLMGVRAGVSSRRWEVFGEVRNLFDADYIATLSVLTSASAGSRVLFPGAPLSAYSGVRVSF